MQKSIKSLLAHRPPFLFLDRLISTSDDEIIGVKTFIKEEHPMLCGSFPDANYVPGMIIVESMAQCGGAGIRQMESAEGLFGLAKIEQVQFLAGAPFDEEIKYTVKNIRVSPKLIKQSGIATWENQVLTKATWVCIKL